MATQVLMPQLGESVTEGTITRWLKQVGDSVNKYEPLCEVETDKVTAEVPATVSGTVSEIIVEEGTTVEVGKLICYIQEQGSVEETTETSPIKTKDTEKEQEKVSENVQSDKKLNSQTIRDDQSNVRYSPAVLRIAQENNVDLTQIQGTGLGGRITRKDVLSYIENGSPELEVNQTLASKDQIEKQQPDTKKELNQDNEAKEVKISPAEKEAGIKIDNLKVEAGDQEIVVNNVRKTIAKRMVQSKNEAPHAWLTVEADVSDLVSYRNKIKNDFKKKENFNLTYLPFFIKAVVEALKEYPIVNSVWAEDRILLKKRINISIAVATEDALFVPVIQDADQKSIYGIAKAIDELAQKTREGRLTVTDLQGGTFTVNNTGTFGSILSAPILNSPQAGIITMESIVKRPVVHQDMIAVRSMVNLCMSLDHRVLDGLVAGRFIQSVKQKLEDMGKKEVSIY